MITLTDDRGLIYSPKSWEEILELPGYIKGLDPTKYKLKAVIGSYHLKDIHCGLTCNAEHDKGVIALFHGGAVTNVGHICGAKHFEVDFTTFTNQYNRDVVAKTYRDLLSTFSFQVEVLEAEIAELRNSKFGVNWIYTTSQNLINLKKECPDEVVKKINSMIKSRSNVLQIEREATKEEVAAQEISQGRNYKKPIYIQQNIALISGLDSLYPENDLKKLVILELEENIKFFKKLNIENLTHSELSKWGKWVSSIDSVKEKINYSIELGLALLKQNNLSAFRTIITNRNDSELFEKFLKKLPH